MQLFQIDEFVWHVEPVSPFKETQWRILARESDPKREPPIKWRCGRTNEADVWEEKVFKQEDLSHTQTPAFFA